MAHVDPNIIYYVIAPILLVSGSAFIGITTLESTESNIVNKLLKVKLDNGSDLFVKLQVELICKDCKKLGKQDCKHTLGKIPHWQDQERLREVEKLMESEGGAFDQEVKGIVSTPNIQPVFPKESIDKFVNNIYNKPIPFTRIFVTADPAAGGNRSKFAIVSCAYHNGKVIVNYFFLFFLLL